MSPRALAGALLAAALASGCEKHATHDECVALLDRYVDLLVRQQTPGVSDADLARQKQQTREKAEGDESFTSCPREVTRSELSCAMGAPNVDEFEKCLE